MTAKQPARLPTSPSPPFAPPLLCVSQETRRRRLEREAEERVRVEAEQEEMRGQAEREMEEDPGLKEFAGQKDEV